MLIDKPWKSEAVLRLLMGLFLSMFLGGLAGEWVRGRYFTGEEAGSVFRTVVGAVSFHGAALVLIGYFLREHEMTWREAFGFGRLDFRRSIGLGVVAGLGVLPLVLLLSWISAQVMSLFGVETAMQEPVRLLQEGVSLEAKIVIGMAAVVVAPLGEELIFRGILYPALKQGGFPRLAMWATSLFFAAIHLNIGIFLPLTILAVLLTLLYEWTGDLLAPIVAHAVFNFMNFFWLVAWLGLG